MDQERVERGMEYEVWASCGDVVPQTRIVATFKFMQEALDYVSGIVERGYSSPVILRKPHMSGFKCVTIYNTEV